MRCAKHHPVTTKTQPRARAASSPCTETKPVQPASSRSERSTRRRTCDSHACRRTRGWCLYMTHGVYACPSATKKDPRQASCWPANQCLGIFLPWVCETRHAASLPSM